LQARSWTWEVLSRQSWLREPEGEEGRVGRYDARVGMGWFGESGKGKGEWCGLTGKGEQLLKCVEADISLVLGEIDRGISAKVLAGGPVIRHGEADATTVLSDVVPAVTCRGESTTKVFSGGAKVPVYGLQCTFGARE
jgi:hypothetical protein